MCISDYQKLVIIKTHLDSRFLKWKHANFFLNALLRYLGSFLKSWNFDTKNDQLETLIVKKAYFQISGGGGLVKLSLFMVDKIHLAYKSGSVWSTERFHVFVFFLLFLEIHRSSQFVIHFEKQKYSYY